MYREVTPNMEKFVNVWAKHLRTIHEKNPERFSWPIEQIEVVVLKMRDAMQRGSFSKDGPAMRATLKELGIRNSYRTINEYFDGIEEGPKELSNLLKF